MKDSLNLPYWLAVMAKVPAHARSVPGWAKTESAKMFSRHVGLFYAGFNGSQHQGCDLAAPAPTTIQTSFIGGKEFTFEKPVQVVEWIKSALARALHEKPCLFFADELYSAHRDVQVALHEAFAEFSVNGLPMHPDTRIAAASNYDWCGANVTEATAPLSNRFFHWDWKFEREAWLDGMMDMGHFPNPGFPRLEVGWEGNMNFTMSMIANGIKTNSTLMPMEDDLRSNYTGLVKNKSAQQKLEEQTLQGPWPSPRSWTNAARCWAAAESYRPGDRNLRDTMINGCVGKGASKAFTAWVDEMDLPDPEDILKWANADRNGRKCKFPVSSRKTSDTFQKPGRTDKMLCMLTSVAQAVRGNVTAERYNDAAHYYVRCSDHEPDTVMVKVKDLISTQPSDACLSPAFFAMQSRFMANTTPTKK